MHIQYANVFKPVTDHSPTWVQGMGRMSKAINYKCPYLLITQVTLK